MKRNRAKGKVSMSMTTRLLMLIVTAPVAGCTAASGHTYHSAGWSPGRPLGRVLVIAPRDQALEPTTPPQKDRMIRDAVGTALTRVAGATVVESSAGISSGPVSDSQAIDAAKRIGAHTVCVVTVGQLYGSFIIPLIPPGWESRTHVTYSLRLLDVQSGELLIESVRHRTTGGYLALTNPAAYSSDLRADVAEVLAATH